MSSLKRIISGTISGLVRNFSNIIIHILSLPIYLTFWSIKLYGVWILLLTVVSILKVPLYSYREYLGNEFLKLGKKNKKKISKILYGSTIIMFLYGAILIFLLILILNQTDFLYYLTIDEALINDVRNALILLFILEILGFVVSLFNHALYPFHYYPKINWISLIITIVVPISQILTVVLGFGLIELSIITFLIVVSLNILFFIYILTLIKIEKINYIKFYFLKNLNHLKKSSFLMLGHFIIIFKNQGVRLILVPFLGSVQMITYVAMKTASNIMSQLFSSFANSFLVEFIDYINEKNDRAYIYSYTMLYIIFILIIIPFAFFFQIAAPVVFEIWTRDKIIFDPILFASMTGSFLIMIFYYPASIILQGKNLYKQSLVISIFVSISFVLILLLMLDYYLIRGAGYTLIIIEILTGIFYFYYSYKWLDKNFIRFNFKIIILTLLDLLISIIFIFIISLNKINTYYVINLFVIFKIFSALFFFKLLPKKIKHKILKLNINA